MPKIDVPEGSRPAGRPFRRLPSKQGRVGWRPALCKAGISALVACGPAVAWAQGSDTAGAAAALKSTCRADYRAHCVGNDPAAPIAAACLAQFYVNLSKNCQAALDAYNAPQSDTTEQE